MKARQLLAILWLCWLSFESAGSAQEYPDIRKVPADLELPELLTTAPQPGQRAVVKLAAWQGTEVYHVVHLPTNWSERVERWPVIVEWAGNGGYENAYGDTCDGRPEGCKLGYGLSAGEDFIWVCLPYLNATGDRLALKWWGDAPSYDPQPTLQYCRAAVESICSRFHGDPQRVVLCGFSRGALACNYLGLHDEQTAKLWCGFLPYSHYDGVRKWPYPDSEPAAALQRLQRLAARPQFVCGEANNALQTEQYLQQVSAAAGLKLDNITCLGTGFRNHNDAWILRPSATRMAARRWLRKTVQLPARWPADLLPLESWKLTIPLDGSTDGEADEISAAALGTYTDARYFYLSAAKDAVLFRAACGAPTTDNSSYPGSELREMLPGGRQRAEWHTNDPGTRELLVEQAILALPAKKPHVVCAQIHHATDDLLMIRLEKQRLFIERPGEEDVLLVDNYQLGQRFRLHIKAGNGRVQVAFNDEPKLDWEVARGGCYYKVGCYTQSNTRRGDAPSAYAEVAVYALQLQVVAPGDKL